MQASIDRVRVARRKWIRWASLSLFGLGCCVSRTVIEDRIRDSRGLPPPAFTVSIGDPNHFTFAAVGDLHIAGTDTSRFARILSAAQSEGDSFIVLLGDLVDQGDAPAYQSYLQAIEDGGWKDKVIPAIGNHDVFNDGWTQFKAQIGPSFYTLSAGNAKFLVLDTADGTLGRDQKEWLKDQLALPRPQNVFLLSHYLPVVPGQRTYLKLSNETESAAAMKLATDFGVTAWLGAHYHSFLVQSIENVVYVVAGGGGGRRMAPVNGYFFVQVVVNGADVKYELRMVD